jgi:glycosyltransferase involved in cell wall biosynthesis
MGDNLNVLMLSQSDAGGGAAIAARRLQDGLRSLGVHSRMLVRRRTHRDETILDAVPWANSLVGKTRFVLDKAPLFRYTGRDGTPFSLQWMPDRLHNRINRLQPDIVHLHWVGHGYMHPAMLARLEQPIVWTMHDVWPFTGGCHANLGCTRYQTQCGACPRLGSTRDRDLSRAIWERKQRAWGQLNLTLVAPSTWMADCARSSGLLRDQTIEVIPNGLDTHVFRPSDRQQARSRLGLPPDKKLILFAVASGQRVPHKGLDLLEATLAHLGANQERMGQPELVLVGPSATTDSVQSGLRTHTLGQMKDDESMSRVFAAVDVTIVPSRQENLPQVALESLACGTPVVAFDTTGVPDVVDHHQNGYLAKPFDSHDLTNGVRWVLEDSDRHGRLREAARAKSLLSFDVDHQARKYDMLYRRLLDERERHSA